MAIYLVQHGLAVDKEVDPDRPLTEDGRRAVEAIADRLQKAGVTVEEVCHSGKTRAEQTAQLFADRLAGGKVRAAEGMGANDDATVFAANLQENRMYVGHLPHVGKVASCLLTGDGEVGVVKFTNAGVVCLIQDENGYSLHWYLVPDLC